jgi:hypothetical protein
MDNGGFRNEDNGGFGNEDGRFGNEDNGIENEEDNDRNVLNEYLFEWMRFDNVCGEYDDEVSVDTGSGGGSGGVDEAVANEAVDVAVAAVMDDEAVAPPLLLGKLVDATIVSPADDDTHADDDLPTALSIPRGLLSGSGLINAPVAECTRRQYNRYNDDFMIYLWDDRPELLSIPEMLLLNRSWASVQRSCLKSSEAYDKAVVRNMKKAGLITVLNPAHDSVGFNNLNAEAFAHYMVYLAERCTAVI